MFEDAKKKTHSQPSASNSPSAVSSDSEAELSGGDVVAIVASAQDDVDAVGSEDDEESTTTGDSIQTMDTIEALAFDDDLENQCDDEHIDECDDYDEDYRGSKFAAQLANSMMANTFQSRTTGEFITNDRYQPVYKYAETNCRGSVRMFSIIDNDAPKLWVEEIDRRVLFDDSVEAPTFIETWNFPTRSIQDGCRNKIIAFRDAFRDYWRLGIIETLSYKVLDDNDRVLDGVISIYAWEPKKSDAKLPIPVLFRCQTWQQAEEHLQKRYYVIGVEDLEIVFLNQVLGPLHLGAKDDVINLSDGAVQASPNGPDTFLPLMPRPLPEPKTPIKRIKLAHPDIFAKSPNGSYKLKQWSKAYSQDPYIQKFIRFNHIQFDKTSKMNYCIIHDLQGNRVPLEDMKRVNPVLEGKLMLPSLLSELRKDNPMEFFVMSKKDVKRMQNAFNGVPMEDAIYKYEAEVSKNLSF